MVDFLKVAEIIKGDVIQTYQNRQVVTLAIDSRKAIAGDQTLFFAIKGERHDGHKYIEDLYRSGVRQFIIEKDIPVESLKEANIVRVPQTIASLQSLAEHHRSQFSLPVIGITGSNGKTIIKEWLFQLLARDYSVVKNPGSYNSQVGVPLSVWQIAAHHQLGIFEAGISQRGEMEKLEKVIRPTIGIFTNIGTAHDEGFDSLDQKISEKLKLFEQVEKLIYCKDHKAIDKQIKSLTIPSLSWGFSKEADIKISKRDKIYLIEDISEKISLDIDFVDQASIENVFHCVAVMLYLGYKQDQIQSSINSLRSVPMRLELKEGINQSQVIDDTYNNDLGGLQISLDFLFSQQQKKKKRLILSDILQSGLDDKTLATNIAEVVNKSGINAFVGIGSLLTKHQQLFKVPSLFFVDTNHFLNDFSADSIQQEIILIKGARTFQFEKIVTRLQKKVHGTVMEIDLGAMVHNLNYFKSKLKPQTKIMVMVKAFAYGSGSNEVASLLQYHQADYLGVAYADEGIELRKNNIMLPIMVMNPAEESFQVMQTFNLEPEIYSFKILQSLLSFLNGQACKIHIKIDTGMHRLGFEEGQLDELIAVLKSNPHLKVVSVFSHLAGADEPQHDEFSRKQAALFINIAQKISKAIGYKPLLHLLNSPGILRLTDLQFDMVRLGIGLYGIDPTAEGGNMLKPVATLKTIISQIRKIKEGESVGYGRRGKAEKEISIATIAIGYADGFSRAYSRGVGEVLVNGKRARVIGNVCMDMTMVDITGTEAKEGDEVIVFGKDLSIEEVAGKINTITYEILTNTSERIKRVFVAESI
jgi:alanine racemase